MSNRKWVMYVVVAMIVSALVTAAYYEAGPIKLRDQQLQSLTEALSQQAPTAVTPANIEFLQTGGSTFDFTTAVAADGSVASQTTKTLAFDIVNKDDTRSASLRILAINPVTNSGGIPDGLNNSYFNLYIKADGKTKYLYTEGKYTDGFSLDLGVAEAFSGTLGITLDQAPANTFTDGQTYTVTLFIYQEASNYVEKVTYTVTT